MSINDLISDWASFEQFISVLCDTEGVSVQRNVTLIGKSGVPRQIDVAITATQGLTRHLVLVECKHWRRKITRQHVDSLTTTIHDLNASRGMIFSTQGFQRGAITLAKHNCIELFRLRDLQLFERFGPTTPMGEYRHYVWRSVRNLQLPGIHCWERDLSHINLNMTLGGEHQSKTRIVDTDDYWGTLEEIIDSWSAQATIRLALDAKALLFNGTGGVRRFWWTVRQTAQPAIQVRVEDAIAIVPAITYDLGLTMWQEHCEVDKALYKFVVAVEDCIRNVVYKAVRSTDAMTTEIGPTADRTPPMDSGHVQRILLMAFELVPFDFDLMDKGKYYDQPGYPEFVPFQILADRRDVT